MVHEDASRVHFCEISPRTMVTLRCDDRQIAMMETSVYVIY